jgi:alkylhydroperoxidase family enzyme
MTAKGKQAARQSSGAKASISGSAQPFLGFDPAELVAVRVRPSDFARMMGVSKQAVSGWIKRGLVTLGPDGRLDPSKAGRQIIANADPAKLRARALRGAMDDVGELRRQLRDAQQRVASLEALSAYGMHGDEVEERLGHLLAAIAAHMPALGTAARLGRLELALDWLAALAFRGGTSNELAEAFAEDAEMLRELFAETMGPMPENLNA